MHNIEIHQVRKPVFDNYQCPLSLSLRLYDGGKHEPGREFQRDAVRGKTPTFGMAPCSRVQRYDDRGRYFYCRYLLENNDQKKRKIWEHRRGILKTGMLQKTFCVQGLWGNYRYMYNEKNTTFLHKDASSVLECIFPVITKYCIRIFIIW